MENGKQIDWNNPIADSPSNWQDSETLFLINCYDVWSATPPRGCQCGDPAPAGDTA